MYRVGVMTTPLLGYTKHPFLLYAAHTYRMSYVWFRRTSNTRALHTIVFCRPEYTVRERPGGVAGVGWVRERPGGGGAAGVGWLRERPGGGGAAGLGWLR